MSDGWSQFGVIGPLLDEGFSVIPNVVLRDRSLSGHAKLTWALIYDYRHQEKPTEMAALQADLGIGEKPTRGAIRELEEAGYVVRKRHGQGRPNSYLLAIPESLIRPEGVSRTAPGADPSFKDVLEDNDVGAKAPTSAGADLAKGRKQNIVFNTLVEVTSANPADGGMIAKAMKAIRTALEGHLVDLRQGYLSANPHEDEVPPDVIDELVAGQIRIRADLYRRLRPEWELTPTALAKHWNRIPTWKPQGGLTPGEIAGYRDEDFGVSNG